MWILIDVPNYLMSQHYRSYKKDVVISLCFPDFFCILLSLSRITQSFQLYSAVSEYDFLFITETNLKIKECRAMGIFSQSSIITWDHLSQKGKLNEPICVIRTMFYYIRVAENFLLFLGNESQVLNSRCQSWALAFPGPRVVARFEIASTSLLPHLCLR